MAPHPLVDSGQLIPATLSYLPAQNYFRAGLNLFHRSMVCLDVDRTSEAGNLMSMQPTNRPPDRGRHGETKRLDHADADAVVGAAAPPYADYSAFYQAEFRPMVALAAAVSGRHEVAEDLAHEALTKAYRHWGRISQYDKPGAWLRRVTVNLALSSRKRFAAEIRAKLRIAAEPTLGPPPERHHDVWHHVRSLAPKQRAAIALFYLEDLPVAEIAQILGCEPATAKVHLHQGRNALRNKLTRSGDAR